MTLRTLKYGNYGIFLIMGNAGFCPSTVWLIAFGVSAQGLELGVWGICSVPPSTIMSYSVLRYGAVFIRGHCMI